MSACKNARPTGSQPVEIRDGTLCCAESPKAGPLGAITCVTKKHRVKVLGFDGARVHEFLFHVALTEIQWLDLNARRADTTAADQKDRANNRALMLYDMFLEAGSKGPRPAVAFLQQQKELQGKYLRRSQALLQTMQREEQERMVWLAKAGFWAQTVKSGATATLAIAGLFLEGPAILAGAGLSLLYDGGIELIKHLGHSHEASANTVVVGFKQQMANDGVAAVGAAKQVKAEGTAEALEKTLNFPKKSGVYRSATATASHMDKLLKTLGYLAAAVTLYSETKETLEAHERLEKIEKSN